MRTLLTVALVALAAVCAHAGGGDVEPTARPLTKLEKAATVLVPNAVPFGFRNIVLNSDNPLWMQTLCDQPYVGPPVAPQSLSPAATEYVLAIQKKNGDGYNSSIGLPLAVQAKCIINGDGKPDCSFLWDELPKTTGLQVIATPPPGVQLTGCTLYFDGTTATSPSCWGGANKDDTQILQMVSAWPEGSIRAINITVNAVDVAGGNTPFTVLYTHCQFAYNFYYNPLGFNPVNQVLATDPRVTNWMPDVGEFGDSGPLRGKNTTTGAPVVQQNYAPKGVIGAGSQVGGR